MQIIAQRDKTLGKILLILSVLLLGLCVYLITVSGWYVVALVFGLFLLGFSFYDVVLLPKTAIKKDGEYLILCYAFSKKRIEISTIEYVSQNELGEFSSRGGGLFSTLHILNNDVRRVAITVKQEGTLKHYNLWTILHASAVSSTINTIIEQVKDKK